MRVKTNRYFPRRITVFAIYFVDLFLGIQTLNIDILKFSNIYAESSNKEPILLLITSGNDPSNELAEYANQKIGKDKFIEV